MANAAWPWAAAFSRRLHELRPQPFCGSHLLFGSDYSGGHASSRYNVYGFVIADADASLDWPVECQKVRSGFLADGRRMGFKNLNDAHRRNALIPFLSASESLVGNVVTVAVTKELRHLSSYQNAIDVWRKTNSLQAKWNPGAFEQMARIAHFFSLLVAAWSTPGANVSWITDEDEIVANAERLTDAQEFAARLAGIFLPHNLGEFMMNTPAVVNNHSAFEDFLASPDLAAGMIGEILTTTPVYEPGAQNVFRYAQLTEKSEIISDWFWHHLGTLKKTCILIERAENGKYGVGRLDMQLR